MSHNQCSAVTKTSGNAATTARRGPAAKEIGATTVFSAFRTVATVAMLLVASGQLTAAQSADNRSEPVVTEPTPIPSGPDDERQERQKSDFEFGKVSGIVYSRGDGYRLTCDVYIPHGEGPFPAVLAVHGGAWRSGSKWHMSRHAWRFARHGFVVVAINYRHAPKYKFPAQLHDCKTAVRWMRRRASHYKIDPDRIAAVGYSAGGHLAAMLGTTAAADGLEGDVPKTDRDIDTRVQAVVAGGAPCEFAWIGETSPALVYWLGATKQADPQLYLAASPTRYASSDDPPFFLFHGEFDVVVPGSTSQALHQRLQDCGVQCQYETVLGMGHVAAFADLTLMDRAIDFLNQCWDESDN